jgi:hypothetical protein
LKVAGDNSLCNFTVNVDQVSIQELAWDSENKEYKPTGRVAFSVNVHDNKIVADADTFVISGELIANALKSQSLSIGKIAGTDNYNFNVSSDGNLVARDARLENVDICGGTFEMIGDGGQAYVSISADGVLNAQGVNVTGNISAASGTIGGFSIANDGLEYVDDIKFTKILPGSIELGSSNLDPDSGTEIKINATDRQHALDVLGQINSRNIAVSDILMIPYIRTSPYNEVTLSGAANDGTIKIVFPLIPNAIIKAGDDTCPILRTTYSDNLTIDIVNSLEIHNNKYMFIKKHVSLPQSMQLAGHATVNNPLNVNLNDFTAWFAIRLEE